MKKEKKNNIFQLELTIIHVRFFFYVYLPSFFFFGSDPKPDDPDVIDESSLTPPPTSPGNVFALAVDGIVRDNVVPGNCVLSTPTISLPKSSRDVIFLLVKLVGLKSKTKRPNNYLLFLYNFRYVSSMVPMHYAP